LALLQRTLGTVLAQRDVELAVIVIDEGSSDGTAQLLAAPPDPRVTSIRHDEPRGVARARNAGLAAATTPWVAFVDDDDLWGPTKLRAQLDEIDRDGEARWSCVGSVVVDPDLAILRAGYPPRERAVADHLLRFNHIPGGGSGVLVDRELVVDAGGFDPSLSTLADWDLWIRLGLRSPLAIVDEPLLAYVEHGGMSQGARDIESELRRVDEAYDGERRARGWSFEWGWWLHWLGELDERAGRRGDAVRHHLRAARAGRRRGLLDAVRAGLGRRGPSSDDRPGEEVTDAWRRAADAWLAPLRASPADASVGLERQGGGQ
jgi:glycosyltransferase involved in cell wall biosynthesis